MASLLKYIYKKAIRKILVQNAFFAQNAGILLEWPVQVATGWNFDQNGMWGFFALVHVQYQNISVGTQNIMEFKTFEWTPRERV